MSFTLDALWPRPKKLELTGESCALELRAPFQFDGPPEIDGIARQCALRLEALGFQRPPDSRRATRVTIELDRALSTGRESYVLSLRPPDRIAIVAHDLAGARHAFATLFQILSAFTRDARQRVGPALECRDWPDFPVRGAMLDVSRSRVPRMETLFALVERLAWLKINQLQIYMEHTFAYRGHEIVWRDAAPFTPSDICALDAFCAERGVDLVPNQQSFGHMHRWLKHDPYRDLAIVPEGIDHAFSLEREPFSLWLSDPRASALLDDLYDQLLPCFSSKLFNVGLDETVDLGHGRSRAECAARGVERVYLDYVRLIRAKVARRGKRMEFWGDIVIQRPELVPELPADLIALEWGYEDGHPFAEHVEHFRRSGLEFHVCPGTSSWQSFAGRTRNMLANVKAAVFHGKNAGSAGCLVTDWGDRGHLQPHFVKEAGLLTAAGLSWNVDASDELDEALLARLLDRHVFADEASVLGRAAVDLGNAYLETGSPATNGSALFFLVAFAPDEFPHPRCPNLTQGGLVRAREHVEIVATRLANSRSARAAEILDEMRFTCDALVLAADLGLARLTAGAGTRLEALDARTRATLSARFEELGLDHARMWRIGDRDGGLKESLRWLERVRDGLAGRT